MSGAFNAKKSVTWHAIAPTYGAMTVIIMDMSPWTAQIRNCHLAHQPAAGLTPMTGVGDLPLDVTVTPDAHAMTAVTPDPTPVTTAIGVIAARTPTEVALDYSTDLPAAASHMTGAPAPTAATATHLTTDLHLIGILPKMTADLNIDPGNIITNQPEDPHPLHRHNLGNIRTKDTNKSQLMTHHQNLQLR